MANWSAYQESLVGLPVAKRAKFGLHFKRPDGLFQADFSGAPCHYLDTDKLWKPIDTALKTVGAEYGAPGLPIRFRLDGRVAVGTHVQQTTRIGLFNPTTRAFSLLATLPNGLISDDKIIRESGIFREEITLKEGGVREELIVASMPSGGAGDWLVLETRIQGGDFPDGDTAEFSREGYQFPLPNARDANRRELLSKRFARKIGAAQYLLTGVPLAALAGAVFPVVIDPDFASTDADTYMNHLNTTTNDGNSTLIYTGTPSGNNAQYSRCLVKFDISSIPTSSTVSAVTCKLMETDAGGAGSWSTRLRRVLVSWAELQATWAERLTGTGWTTAGCASDGNDRAAGDSASVTLDGTSGNAFVEWTGATLTDDVQKFVSATYSNYGWLVEAPTAEGVANTYNSFGSSENATPGNRPVLTVVYTYIHNFGAVIG